MTFNLDICKFEGQSHRMKNVPFRLRIALYLLLRPRSIVMSASVCLFVCLSVCLSVRQDISGTTRAIFTKFLCVLPMSVARSSSSMFTIGCIAYRREGFSSPLPMHYSALAAKGTIRSPVTSCITRDHSVAARLLKMGSAGKGVTGVHSAGEA